MFYAYVVKSTKKEQENIKKNAFNIDLYNANQPLPVPMEDFWGSSNNIEQFDMFFTELAVIKAKNASLRGNQVSSGIKLFQIIISVGGTDTLISDLSH